MGIEHLAILAKDTFALKEWYLQAFGGKTVYDNGKGTYFIAFDDGSMIEFITAGEDTPEYGTKAAGIRHIAISVTEAEFDGTVKKLKADAKVAELTDVATGSNGVKTYFFRDPDGNILHLIYRPAPLV